MTVFKVVLNIQTNLLN